MGHGGLSVNMAYSLEIVVVYKLDDGTSKAETCLCNAFLTVINDVKNPHVWPRNKTRY
jgi:hypothetical protein